MEIMEQELFNEIAYGDAEDLGYTKLGEGRINQRRWSIDKEIFFRRNSDGKMFGYWWSEPATECQEQEFYPPVECWEVIEAKRIITEYRRKAEDA